MVLTAGLVVPAGQMRGDRRRPGLMTVPGKMLADSENLLLDRRPEIRLAAETPQFVERGASRVATAPHS